jgi:hypothetical protein
MQVASSVNTCHTAGTFTRPVPSLGPSCPDWYQVWESYDPDHPDRPSDVFRFVNAIGGYVDWSCGRAYPCRACASHLWLNFRVLAFRDPGTGRLRRQVQLHHPPHYVVGYCTCEDPVWHFPVGWADV